MSASCSKVVLSRKHILAIGPPQPKFSLKKKIQQKPQKGATWWVFNSLHGSAPEGHPCQGGAVVPTCPCHGVSQGHAALHHLGAGGAPWRRALSSSTSWASRGTPARRTLWDQCVHLSLRPAALPARSQAPAGGSCCWLIVRRLSASSPRHLPVTPLRCHLLHCASRFRFLGSWSSSGTRKQQRDPKISAPQAFRADAAAFSHFPVAVGKPATFLSAPLGCSRSPSSQRASQR